MVNNSENSARQSADSNADPSRFKQGFFRRTVTKRWAIDGYFEITSGEMFEIRLGEKWIKVRMEHNGRDYYTIPSVVLCDGLEVRQALF